MQMQPKEHVHKKTDWRLVILYTAVLISMIYGAWDYIPATAAEQAAHAASGRRRSWIPLRVLGWFYASIGCGMIACIVKEVRRSRS